MSTYAMRRAAVGTLRRQHNLLHLRPYTHTTLRVITSSNHRQLRPFSCTPIKNNFSETASHDNPVKMSASEALERRLAEIEAERILRVHPTSPRTGRSITSDDNLADKMERHLRTIGHRIWGFVVYRCTYTDDKAWESCIEQFHAEILEYMDDYKGHDLLQDGSFQLTVFDDANLFDKASVETIRQHFNDWSAHAVREEQGSPEEIKKRQKRCELHDEYLGDEVRYTYCVRVDEASMQSILSSESGADSWVDVIKADWKPQDEAEDPIEEDDEFSGGDDEEYPAIEGCTEEDVGWITTPLCTLLLDTYLSLAGAHNWNLMYSRPPDIAE